MVAKTINLPNIKKCFRPDPGYIICDADLDRADAQVVAWEADDISLKVLFREGLDIHLANASAIFRLGITFDHLRDEAYTKTLQVKYKPERDMAKRGVHATNYGSNAHTLAKHLNITVKEAEQFQDFWFSAHPGIAAWHDRISDELQTRRQVFNKFGYRRFYFDRVQNLLPEALAWVPQSTVACVINRGWYNLYKNIPEIQVLLQVHDSLVFQVPTDRFRPLLPEIKKNLLITIPYEDPLVIGVGLKASTKNWGDAVEYTWKGERA